MIELIFVVIIIGVLASIAVSKLGSMKNVADLANAKSDVASIRSAIFTERQRSLVQGNPSYIPKLSADYVDTVNPSILFDGNGGRKLLTYGMKRGTGAGEWDMLSDTQYSYNSGSQTTTFDYNSTTGSFNCTAAVDNDCDKIAN